MNIISDLMLNKKKYDGRSNNVPETIKDYMGIYYLKKYGLKQIATNEINALIDSLKIQSLLHPEMLFYYKLIEGRIDEMMYW